MKRNQKRTLSKVLAYIFQISLSLIFVLPLVWMIVSSLKPEADLFKDMSSIATFFVSNPSLDNYKEMLSRSLVLKSTLNSMIYIVLILLIGIPVNALCGYVLARLRFPGKNFILSAIIVVLPNTKPVIAIATVLTIVTHWSDFMWPLMAVTSPEHKTIQLAIQGFFTDPPVRYAPIMAVLVFSTIPILIVYLLLQKYYVQGIMSSGIKR